MRIRCPACKGLLSISEPKPGTYRPKCTYCDHAFLVRVSDGKTPSVRVEPATSDIAAATPVEAAKPPNNDPSNRIGEPKRDATEIPDRLGGYKILRLIGRGAMGEVYEAKQVSLDRLVALKTIRGRLSENPASLARFAREAYAAAQLTHHNIVQIYDFGEDDGRYFFSMEWVRGGPLDSLIRKKGAIDSKLAAGYALQAARGLQFAHRHGMVHRDIKPANLLLSDDGVIKVADLGLVKVPDHGEVDSDSPTSAISGMASGTQVTMQGTAVGTPAYMAPEQGIDAAAVDHRADIYSLGCSLYCMLTGHPPFQSPEVSEVLEQHANQPFPSLKEQGERIPEPLQDVIRRSTAKSPGNRYTSVSAMIDDLESYLGVSSDGSFSPSKQQSDEWESIAASYSNAAPLARYRHPLHATWIALCGLLTIAAPVMNWQLWVTGPAMLVASIATSSILTSQLGQSVLSSKVRSWLGSMSWIDWMMGSISLMIALTLVILFGWWPGLLLGVLVGGIAGAGDFFGLQVPANKQRADAKLRAERFVRDLRVHGVDEQGMRRFIARYSGPNWQELFEDLFGYDALSATRDQLSSDPTFTSSTSHSLRDVALGRLSASTRANRSARDQNRLASIEQRGLTSEGLDETEARKRAWQIAAALMEGARSELPGSERLQSEREAEAAHEKRIRVKAMLADARSGRYKQETARPSALRRLFSSPMRLLAGCVLLAVFAWRGYDHGFFDGLTGLDGEQLDFSKFETVIRPPSSDLPGEEISKIDSETTRIKSILSLGIAGLLLAMSAIVSGWRMTPFAVAATTVILAGPAFGIPDLGPLPAWVVAAIAGLAIYLPGYIFGETE